MTPEILAPDLSFLEGPVWCPDGTLVVTGVGHGTLHRIDLASGSHAIAADTGGGPNGAALCSDGGFLVTQNGGFDFSKTRYAASAPPYRPRTPALQRVLPGGEVRALIAEGLRAPNDLAVAPDGTVYFTDPGPFPPPDPRVGRVLALDAGGGLREIAGGFTYCNGVGVEAAGTLVVVEKRGLMRFDPNAPDERAWVIETLGPGGGDGFAADVEGRFYVAAASDHGIRVIDADGSEVDFLSIPGEGVTTNCCFGGPDLRTLFATEMLPGGVALWEGMPVPGVALTPWSVPA